MRERNALVHGTFKDAIMRRWEVTICQIVDKRNALRRLISTTACSEKLIKPFSKAIRITSVSLNVVGSSNPFVPSLVAPPEKLYAVSSPLPSLPPPDPAWAVSNTATETRHIDNE